MANRSPKKESQRKGTEQTLRWYLKKIFLKKIFNFILKEDTVYLRISIPSNKCQDILVKSIDILEKEKNNSFGH